METEKLFFSPHFLIDFIEAYRNLPCLWMAKSPDYFNFAVKQKAWEDLVKVTRKINPSADISWVKKKVHTMRGSFRKEIKKVQASYRSGAGPDELYKPKLWYFEYLLFTKNEDVARQVSGNAEEDRDEDSLDYAFAIPVETASTTPADNHATHTENGEDPISEFEESALSEEDVKDFEVLVNPEHVVVNTPENTSSTTRTRKRRKPCPEENGVEETNSVPKRPTVEEASNSDEIAMFCDLLGVKLRALNENLRETAMYEMNSIMYHLKMQQMNQVMGGAYPAACGSPCAAHMTGFPFRSCPRLCGYSCPPTPQIKTPQQNSRQ